MRAVDEGELYRGYSIHHHHPPLSPPGADSLLPAAITSHNPQRFLPGKLHANSPRSVGNKKDNITIIYTPWSNLRKDGSMATGQVGFHDPRKVKRILIETRVNAIINRLNKTKEEKYPDLREEKEEHMKEIRKKEREANLKRQKEEQRIAKERKEEKWRREHAYDDVFVEEEMESNQGRTEADWDDFM